MEIQAPEPAASDGASRRIILRIASGAVAALACVYVVLILLHPDREGFQLWVAGFAGAIALFSGWVAWGIGKPDQRRLMAGGCRGATLVGGIGFIGGFVGPILLMPEANQGPLLGIFITGPLGLIIGLLLGITVAAVRRP